MCFQVYHWIHWKLISKMEKDDSGRKKVKNGIEPTGNTGIVLQDSREDGRNGVGTVNW